MTDTDLVTGGDGFIGSALVRHLLEQGRAVRVLCLPGVDRGNIDGLPIEVVEGDVTRPDTLEPAVRDVDRVYHLAAVARDWGPASLFEAVNVDGTASLVRAAAQAGAQRVVFVSSLAVHAYRGHLDADEQTARDAKRPAYSLSKIAAEDAVTSLCGDASLPFTIVRPAAFPYGPRDRTSFAPLADELMKGGPPFVGGGKARLCTVYVDNLAEGLYLAATREEARGQTYIIADDGAPSWRELIGAFADALGTRAPRLSIPTPVARMAGALVEGFCWLTRWRLAPPITRYRVAIVARDCHFSNAKAKAQLDWTPRVSFEAGVERTVDWYLTEGRD